MIEWEDWQKPYLHGSIVIWPPDDVREAVNSQRNAYDPVSQSFCEAHISVTQPLLRTLESNEWKGLVSLIREFQAFRIDYGPVKSFLPYPCIWHEIRPKNRILELRQALHGTGCFNLGLSHTDDFIPHMTITEGASGPAVNEDLLRQIQASSTPGSFKCDELSYVRPDEQFSFSVHGRLTLGANASANGA
jgi:2'-5' RNA ligase